MLLLHVVSLLLHLRDLCCDTVYGAKHMSFWEIMSLKQAVYLLIETKGRQGGTWFKIL